MHQFGILAVIHGISHAVHVFALCIGAAQITSACTPWLLWEYNDNGDDEGNGDGGDGDSSVDVDAGDDAWWHCPHLDQVCTLCKQLGSGKAWTCGKT